MTGTHAVFFFWVRNFALLLFFLRRRKGIVFTRFQFLENRETNKKGNKWAVLGLVLSLSWKSLSRALLDSHHALLHWLLFFHTRQQLCLWAKSRTCWLALNLISPGRWNCCHAGLPMPARFANIDWFRLVRFLLSCDWIATEVKSLGLVSCDWIATACVLSSSFDEALRCIAISLPKSDQDLPHFYILILKAQGYILKLWLPDFKSTLIQEFSELCLP